MDLEDDEQAVPEDDRDPQEHTDADRLAEFYAALAEVASDAGYPVDRRPWPEHEAIDTGGYMSRDERRIWISRAIHDKRAATTLAHELGHVFDPGWENGEDEVDHRERSEAVARLVAFMVCDYCMIEPVGGAVVLWPRSRAAVDDVLQRAASAAWAIKSELDQLQGDGKPIGLDGLGRQWSNMDLPAWERYPIDRAPRSVEQTGRVGADRITFDR